MWLGSGSVNFQDLIQIWLKIDRNRNIVVRIIMQDVETWSSSSSNTVGEHKALQGVRPVRLSVDYVKHLLVKGLTLQTTILNHKINSKLKFFYS